MRARLALFAKAIALALAFALLGRVLFNTDWAGAAARLEAAGPVLLLVLLPFPLGLALDTAAWKCLLGALGERVALGHLYRVRIATEAITNVLPAGGLFAEGLGPVLLAPGTPIAKSFTASVTKRWLIIRTHGYYVVLAVALGYAGLAARSRAILGQVGLAWVVLACGLGLVGVSLAVQAVSARGGVAVRLHTALAALRSSRLLGRLGLGRNEGSLEDSRGAFERADAHLADLGGRRHPVPSAFILGTWMLEATETYVILHVLGAPVSCVDVLVIEASLSVVRTAAVFAPAGIGFQDVGYLAFFAAYGVPAPEATGPAFVVVKRTKELLFIALGMMLLLARRTELRSQAPVPVTEASVAEPERMSEPDGELEPQA